MFLSFNKLRGAKRLGEYGLCVYNMQPPSAPASQLVGGRVGCYFSFIASLRVWCFLPDFLSSHYVDCLWSSLFYVKISAFLLACWQAATHVSLCFPVFLGSMGTAAVTMAAPRREDRRVYVLVRTV